jgi:hypothetical protein
MVLAGCAIDGYGDKRTSGNIKKARGISLM